ncbi:Ulp1 family isopeptidase [Rickettsia endosymbiont of Halotydeus destructor]|uniref:Ulp1 family isopeptidase n=1 Tax=Rickettsia endosymbiont of Halotydeus destructor TaxID=2996754 RepID=UPI003BAF902D
MTKQKENISTIFTLSLGGADIMLQKINTLRYEQDVSVVSLKANASNDLPDKDRIMGALVSVNNNAQPRIFNIQFSSNDRLPIIGLKDLKNSQILGAKTSFTFNNYKTLSPNTELENIWKKLLPNVNHVFFANAQDQGLAVSDGFIAKEKTSNLQTILNANTLVSKILQQPINMEKDMNPTLPSDNDQSPSSHPNINTLNGNPPPIPEEIKQEIVEEYRPQPAGFFREVFNYFKEIVGAIREKIFGKKQEEAKPIINPLPPKTEIVKEKQEQLYQESKKPEAQLMPPSNKTAQEETGITKLQAESARVEQQLVNDTTQEKASEANTASKESLALTSSINDVVKPNYLYTDDNIRQILENSLDEPNKVIIQQLSLAWPDDLKESMLSEIVKTMKEEGKDYSLIPIETGGEHWTGMVATYNKENDEVTFTYNDPMGNPIDNRPGLLNLIKKVEPTAIIIDLKTKQQENAYDCGVFVCDNLTKYAKGQEILSTEQSKGAGANLRKSHAEILTKELTKQQAKEIGHKMQNSDSSFISRINSSSSKERTRG